MFTVTLQDYLEFNTVSYDDFRVRIGCAEYANVSHQLFYRFCECYAQGLKGELMVMTDDPTQYLGYIVKGGGPDVTEAFFRTCREMYEQGLKDSTNIRFLVSKDSDYGNWYPVGLFLSLEGANACGMGWRGQGYGPNDLKIDVLFQRP